MAAIGQLEIGGDHQEVGRAIGRRFGDQVHRLFDNYSFLQQHLLPFCHSPAGQELYQAFLALHQAHFPGYIAELEGIAQGAERPFQEVFLVNLRGEFGGLLALNQETQAIKPDTAQGCTDCLVLTPEAALIGHNEDGTPAAQGNMYVAKVRIGAGPSFAVLGYPGFLPGNAFGFNAHGIMHTVDAVSPRQTGVGLGRHFLARSLLEAESLADALERVTVPNRASGFTYNIGSILQRKLISVEVAPGQHHAHEVQGCTVHTNHYLNLRDTEQRIGDSSRARLARGQALCQSHSAAGSRHVLALLGDESDHDYPIYRTARPPDGSATLCTALFDLDARQLLIYTGHPQREPGQHEAFDLDLP